MAVRDYTATRRADGTVLVTWTGLLNGDSGAPYEAPVYADRAMQVTGTFSTGGTLLMEGTIDGTNYATLTDPQGDALSFTSARIEQVMELATKMRPRVSAGDGSTSLAVSMLIRIA